jgi:ribosomal protein L12E/L44/L45/RPP1/RPP2
MITEPTEDKVENDNPADVYNTVLKMAKKRAQVDATLTATGTSDLLTQDIEEMVEAANAASAENSGGATAAEKKEEKKEPRKAAEPKKRTTSKAPDVQSELPKEEFEKLWAFMEAGKAKFLLMANDEVTTPFAWAWAVRTGKILETEKLEAITATKLFPSCSLNAMIPANQPFMKADYMEAVEEITAIGKAGPLGDVERIAYEKAYGLLKKEPAKKTPAKASEVPRDIEAEWKSIQIPGWSKHVKELGFKTFGDLPKKYLWWWCCKWEPQGYEGKPPKQADIELRKVLDFVKDNYDFESKEDDGSAPGSAEPAPSEPFRDDSDVPF